MDQNIRDEIETSAAERNFILQQGFDEPAPLVCHLQYSALLFQPRIVGLTVLIGTVFQSHAVFLALAIVLWWNALLPKWNPFDAAYNLIADSKSGRIRLTSAPGPRRFAQGLAGVFALVIGVSLMLKWMMLAYVAEVLMIAEVSALVFGRFCLGSFIFHVLSGRGEFARHTLPWVKR